MKQKFERPVAETIRFGNDVIATSCPCDVAGIELGNSECEGSNLPACYCESVVVDPDKNC